MKRKWYMRTLAVALALLICISIPIRAMAIGEGFLIGLTFPEIALIVLAMAGVIYAVENGPELGEDMNRALTMDTRFVEADFNAWAEDAKAGLIRLSTAPDWISDALKKWVKGFVTGDSYVNIAGLDSYGHALRNSGDTIPAQIPAYSPYINSGGSTWSTYDTDVIKCGSYIRNVADGTATTQVYLYYFAPYSGAKMTGYYHYEWTSNVTDVAIELFGDGWQYGTNSGVVTTEVGSEDDEALLRNLAGFLDNTVTMYTLAELFEKCVGGTLGTAVNIPRYPTDVIGGMSDVYDRGIDDGLINIPDLRVPSADVLGLPEYSTIHMEKEAVLQHLYELLISGQITWEEYCRLLGEYDSKHGTDQITVTIHDQIYKVTDKGVSNTSNSENSSDIPYSFDLTQFFPFCIPFDIYEFLSLLAAEPEAPVFSWVIPVPQMDDSFTLTVDLSAWDDVARIFRAFELLAFILGLALITRNKILRG